LRLICCQPGADYSTADVFNGYVAALRDLGHDVGTFNLNVRLDRTTSWLNHCWRKAGRPEGEKPDFEDVLFEAGWPVVIRSLLHSPDWVILFSGLLIHPSILSMLRRVGVPTAMVMTESPYADEDQVRFAPLVDVVFTNERTSVPKLAEANPRTFYLPAAYDPTVHAPTEPDPFVAEHDVVFVGTFFKERIELLSAVDWSGIDLGLYGYVDLIPSRHRLRQYVKGDIVANFMAAQLYRRAKIGLNLYRTSLHFTRDSARIEGAESVNPRALELAACETFFLSDERAEHAEIFGDAVPTFRSSDELGALVRAFLSDPAARTRHAQAGSQAVAPHTFRARAETLLGQLQRLRRAA
jgi:hypothetical protein